MSEDKLRYLFDVVYTQYKSIVSRKERICQIKIEVKRPLRLQSPHWSNGA